MAWSHSPLHSDNAREVAWLDEFQVRVVMFGWLPRTDGETEVCPCCRKVTDGSQTQGIDRFKAG